MKINLHSASGEEVTADEKGVRIMDGAQFDCSDLEAVAGDIKRHAVERPVARPLDVASHHLDDIYLAKLKALCHTYAEAARRRAGINLSKDRLQILGPDGPYAETCRRAEGHYLVGSLVKLKDDPALAVFHARREAARQIKQFLITHRDDPQLAAQRSVIGGRVDAPAPISEEAR